MKLHICDSSVVTVYSLKWTTVWL